MNRLLRSIFSLANASAGDGKRDMPQRIFPLNKGIASVEASSGGVGR